MEARGRYEESGDVICLVTGCLQLASDLFRVGRTYVVHSIRYLVQVQTIPLSFTMVTEAYRARIGDWPGLHLC